MSLWLRFLAHPVHSPQTALAHPVHSSQTAVSKDVAQPTGYRPGVRRDDIINNNHNYNNIIIFISATVRSDSAVQCHLTACLFCEGGGGVRFIPA